MGSEDLVSLLSPSDLYYRVTSECLLSLSGPQRSHQPHGNYSCQLRGTQEVIKATGNGPLGQGLEFFVGMMAASAFSEGAVQL